MYTTLYCFTYRLPLNLSFWTGIILLLILICPVQANLFSGDYVYTLQKNRVIRTLGGTPVSLLAPNDSSLPSNKTERQTSPRDNYGDYGALTDQDNGDKKRRQESSISARMKEQFRQIHDQADQIVADSFDKHTDLDYTPEFVDQTLLHANDAKIRAAQTTAARVQNRLSQLQTSNSPTAAAERAALQEQINLLKIKEDRLRAEQQELRN